MSDPAAHANGAPAPRPGHSLRLRLTLWVVAIALAVHVALSLVALSFERRSLEKLFRTGLELRATAMGEAIRARGGALDDEVLVRVVEANRALYPNNDWTTVVYNPAMGAVACTRRPAPPAQEIGADRFAAFSPPSVRRTPTANLDREGDGWSRVRLEWLETPSSGPVLLAVVSNDWRFEEMFAVSWRMLLLTAPAGLIAAACGGWMISGLVVAPLLRLRRVAGSVFPDDSEHEGAFEAKAGSRPPREILELEDELRSAKSRLQSALLAQERFISSVSHELKTPIAALLAEAQTIDQRGFSEQGQTFVRSVSEEMRLLKRTVDSFLTLTQIRGGASLRTTRPCAINDVVMEAVESCRKMAAQYKVTLAPELSMSEATPRVEGDCDLLRVMVENLLRNAIRFSPEQCRVLARVVDQQSECLIEVKDFGPGIPEAIMPTLFDRFVRAPDERHRGRGHGLGLSIAQGIAELHGGIITVRNEPYAGCTFTVTIPSLASDQGV